jgi:hypothetical protein
MITYNIAWSLGATPNKSVEPFGAFICSHSQGDLTVADNRPLTERRPDAYPHVCATAAIPRLPAQPTQPRNPVNPVNPVKNSALGALRILSRSDASNISSGLRSLRNPFPVFVRNPFQRPFLTT